MPRVTALRERRGGRVDVELDGAEWRTLATDVVVRAGLHEGLELDRGRLRLLRREVRRSEGLARAARSLRAREFSTAGLDDRLRHAGIPPSSRRDALEALTSAGLVDDDRLAATLAESLAGRGWGDVAIRARLEREGIPGPAVQGALAAIEPESERVERIMAARGRTLATARYLSRRGFTAAAVEGALDPLAYEP